MGGGRTLLGREEREERVIIQACEPRGSGATSVLHRGEVSHHDIIINMCRDADGLLGDGDPPPSSITSLSYSMSFSGHVHVALLIIQPMTDVFLALHYITFPVIQ